METSQVEQLYSWIDNTTEKIQQSHNEPYIESLIITLEMLYMDAVPDRVSEVTSKELQKQLEQKFNTYDTVTIRKAVQLAILKGMRVAQEKHLMTPETVALLIGYLAEKITINENEIRVFDPVCGTGNLLMTVLQQLKQRKTVFASEVDPTLIQLAVLNANLQKKEIEFFHQDSMQSFLMDPVDLVVADLPVGYYPDNVQANGFTLKNDSGLSYAHHLILEQSVYYTKPGGYLIFVIPSFLFESDQADKLHAFIRENAHIIGVLQLPETAFTSDKHMKSILILQKKSIDTHAPKQPLLVNMPSFKKARATEDIINQMDAWFAQYMNYTDE
ncbi:MAG TPA: class I SAM-dependent methyltransferase [Bacillota bacterium]|nr:class I SAM-dependent methyltransferase [Bacillota bacterium]